MRKPFRFPFSGSLVFLGTLGGFVTVMACTVPVFRFALDRWEADPYRLIVPASEAAQPDLLRLLVPLRGNGEANVTVVETDDPSLTGARLLFPHHDETLWEGSLDRATLEPLLSSPARTELRQRLLAGESAVWLVFTTESDRAEVDRIAKRLAFLEQVASLPEQDPSDPDSQLGPGPALRLAFSVLAVSLDDPAETLFAKMAAGPGQANLVESGVSFAAPVFGRGRILGSWPTAELDDAMIEDASLFLTGRCSCRVKNENPGWDIILKVDWERALLSAAEAESNGHAAEISASTTETMEPDLVVTEPTPAAEPGSRFSINGLAGAAIALCLAGGFVLWYRR